MLEEMLGEADMRGEPQLGILIDRPVQDVWDYVMDLPGTPRWRPRMSGARWTSDGPPEVGSRFEVSVRMLGYTFRFDLEVTEWEPPHYFAYLQEQGPVRIDSAMEWVAEGDGCRFLIGGNPTTRNVMVKMAEPFLRSSLIRQNMDDLRRLKSQLEAG